MNIDLIKQKVGIIGESEGISQVLEMVAQVANVDISVLINGESGTGKELVSKALHLGSKRASSDLVIVNCGAIPEGIIESELFGHKKGAYTDASDSRKGYFETANKGTIFLDEIGDMPLETQVKVLRVLESGEFMRVGDSVAKKTDVRVLAATNKELGKLVKEGKFRQDLYYRLKTVTINIPPLRKRKNDIRLLVDRFALQFSRSNNIKYKGFTPESIKEMHNYHWPGNVRELRNFVESILILQKGERITAEMVSNQLAGDILENNQSNDSLPVVLNRDPDQAERELILRQLLFLRQDIEDLKLMMKESSFSDLNSSRSINQSFDSTIHNNEIINQDDNLIKGEAIGAFNTKDLEKEMIIRTLEHFNNNRRASAKSLDMSERTLYRKINDYGIEKKIKKDN
jgi:DNA-binding NtrC family response regulator